LPPAKRAVTSTSKRRAHCVPPFAHLTGLTALDELLQGPVVVHGVDVVNEEAEHAGHDARPRHNEDACDGLGQVVRWENVAVAHGGDRDHQKVGNLAVRPAFVPVRRLWNANIRVVEGGGVSVPFRARSSSDAAKQLREQGNETHGM